MSAEDAIRKGNAAKALLENSDFNTALDVVRLQAFKEWSGSLPAENDKREQNYYLLQAIERLKDNLNALVANSKYEQHKADITQAESETEKGDKV